MESIYSLEEAADKLKITKNALARAARAAGRGAVFGRSLRFTDDDLAAILAFRRVPRSHSLNAPNGPGAPLDFGDPLAELRQHARTTRDAEKARRAAENERSRKEREAARQPRTAERAPGRKT